MNLLRRLKASWQPKPINPPTVDPELQDLDGLTRSAESFRYSIVSVEWWISRNGQVREWLRQNTWLAVILFIPAVLVLPLVALILFQLVHIILMLVTVAGHLIVLPVLMLAAALVILVVVNIARSLFR